LFLFAGFFAYFIYKQAFLSGSESSTRRRGDVTVAVDISPVEKADIHDVGYFNGTLHPVSQFIVAPKIAGRLKSLPLDIGDKILPGQLVAILDDEEYLQQVDQARAELEVAKANQEESQNTLGNLRRELSRTQALRKKKIASESELDTASSRYKTQKSKLEVARAQFFQKEAALRVSQVRLSYSQIRMTKTNSGNWVVGERFVHEGAMLAPNKPIITILDIQFLVAAIHVIERDYARIQIGMTAEIYTDAFPEQVFEGEIKRIAPILKESSRQARVEIEIPNSEALLKPGMFIRTRIEFDRHYDATIVPVGALIKLKGIPGIFSADTKEMKARFIPVTTGIINDTRAEIIAPKLSGFVVTLGHHLLEDGSTITIVGKLAGSKPKNKNSGKPRKKDGSRETGKGS